MKHIKWEVWAALIVSILFLWSCGGGSNGSSSFTSGSTGSGNTGTLSLSLVDKPGGSYKAVYVTIKAVQVCYTAGPCSDPSYEDCQCRWETVAEVNETFNLLELVNGVMAGLGQKDLETGTYNQLRLLLGEEYNRTEHPYAQYLIDENDKAHELKVPSGYQTGIKLVHQFDIVKGLTTELILDFDVARSVIKAGNSGKYLLKPTIKVIGTYNRAIVSGVVTNNEGTPLDGTLNDAKVSAWHMDGDGNWILAMSTPTAPDGGYTLYLDLGGPYEIDPKDYKIVTTATGYEPDCTEQTITVEVDGIYPEVNFELLPTVSATVAGTLSFPEPQDGTERFVEISFWRQVGNCFLEPVQTAIETIVVESGETTVDFTIEEIPEGTYDITASSAGFQDINVLGYSVPGDDLIFDFIPMPDE